MQTKHVINRATPAVMALATFLLAVLQRGVSAHEKWFHEAQGYPLRLDLLMRPLPLAFIGAIVVVTLLAGILWRMRGCGFVPGPEHFGTTGERRSLLYGLVPLILGIHIAVPLLVNGVQGKLFSPDNTLAEPWNYFLGLAQTGVALALFYGAFTRLAAAALAALWLLGLFVVGPEAMLDNAFYLGFAAFFFCAGRGPISVDRLVLPKLEPSARLMEYAIPALRIGLGLSLVVVAFTEKFANIPLATSFLQKYPLNFTQALGIPMSDELFVLCAGSVELLAGLLILFGIFPREIVLVAWVPINMTLAIFNWTELVGHLPIYGTMAVLLLWSPGRENLTLWVQGLRGGPLKILQPTTPAVETTVPEVSTPDNHAQNNGLPREVARPV